MDFRHILFKKNHNIPFPVPPTDALYLPGKAVVITEIFGQSALHH